MAFDFLKLPYALNSLEPHISRRTMEVHYEKHYKKYVSSLNKLIIGTDLEDKTIEEIILKTGRDDGPIFNNAAQAWNHSFFWSCLSPLKPTPSPKLLKAIENQFDSLQEFKNKFSDTAVKLFGSGWVWLVKEPDGSLKIEAMANAGNPMTQGRTPLLVCDLWEHAYYLDFQNERTEYLMHFFSVVNWNFLEENLTQKQSVGVPPHITRSVSSELQNRI